MTDPEMDRCSVALQATRAALPPPPPPPPPPPDENPPDRVDSNSDAPDRRASSENVSEDSGDVDMEYVDAHEPGTRQGENEKCSLTPENLLSVLPFFSSSNHFGMNDDKGQAASTEQQRPAATSSNAPASATSTARNTVFQMQPMKAGSGNVPPNVPLSKDLFNLMTIDTGINFASLCTSIGAPSESSKRDRHAVELTNQVNKLKTELNNVKDDMMKKDKCIKQVTLDCHSLEEQLKEEKMSCQRLKNIHTECVQTMFATMKREKINTKFLKRHYKSVREENLQLMTSVHHMKKELDEVVRKLNRAENFSGYHQFSSIDLHHSDHKIPTYPSSHGQNPPVDWELTAKVSSPALKELENPTRETPNDEIRIFTEDDGTTSLILTLQSVCNCCKT